MGMLGFRQIDDFLGALSFNRFWASFLGFWAVLGHFWVQKQRFLTPKTGVQKGPKKIDDF